MTVPGYTGASPGHWMHHLRHDVADVVQVDQQDWHRVEREAWIDAVERVVRGSAEPVLLVGHSCGSVSAVQYLSERPATNVIGAVLVAPADVDSPTALPAIRPQRPLPQRRLPVPTRLVASRDDPHLAPERAELLSRVWGADLSLLSTGGHFATDDGFGPWPYIATVVASMLAGSPAEGHSGRP